LADSEFSLFQRFPRLVFLSALGEACFYMKGFNHYSMIFLESVMNCMSYTTSTELM